MQGTHCLYENNSIYCIESIPLGWLFECKHRGTHLIWRGRKWRKIVAGYGMQSRRVSRCSRVGVRSGLSIVLALAAVPLVHGENRIGDQGPQKDIQVVLDKQVVAWNHRDLEGFMAGYWKSPDLVYLSNTATIRGWQTLLDRFRQLYQPPNESNMGTLSLPQEEIIMLGRDSAVVWGTFIVTTNDGKALGGRYTLAMRRFPEGWRTLYDRTSTEALPQGGKQ
jgi:hypothetical protein